jgi:hypothetical protein
MRLNEALMGLKEILERDYGLAQVEFSDDLEYEREYHIPGFTFYIRDPNQIPVVDKLFTEVKREVMKGYAPKGVTCYLVEGGSKQPNYREVHLNIRQGYIYGIASDLVEKLTQNLKQRGPLKYDGTKRKSIPRGKKDSKRRNKNL